MGEEELAVNPRRITMLRRWCWRPPEMSAKASICYRAGKTYFVRLKCAEAAIEEGAAVYADQSG